MSTHWTNSVTSGSPIRAFDIQEVVNAINSNRSAAGLPAFPWTDGTVSAGTPIKAVHFTELRDAIQGLWMGKSMGSIPAWSEQPPGGLSAGSAATPIRASHLTDVRSWLNFWATIKAITEDTYENDAGDSEETVANNYCAFLGHLLDLFNSGDPRYARVGATAFIAAPSPEFPNHLVQPGTASAMLVCYG